jgi:hypothetical protein
VPDDSLVAGNVGGEGVVARVDALGRPDTSVGNRGATIHVPSTAWGCVAPGNEARALVAGDDTGTNLQTVRTARYTRDGLPDVTFGQEGTGLITVAQGADVCTSDCRLDEQGHLVVAGATRSSTGAPLPPFLARVWN